MKTREETHKDKMEDLYARPKFPEAVDLWAAYYAKDKEEIRYSDWRHLNPERQSMENKIWNKWISPGSRILDAGCGKGFFLKRIYESFGESIAYEGIDLSSHIIQEAQRHFSPAIYTVGAAEKLPYPEAHFDYVQFITVLAYVMDVGAALKEACRVLKPGGRLLMVNHRSSLDPLLAYSLYRSVKDQIQGRKKDPCETARHSIVHAAEENGLTLLECGHFAAHINFPFYRRLKVPADFLMGVVEFANRLPGGLFKNLEYRVYQK